MQERYKDVKQFVNRTYNDLSRTEAQGQEEGLTSSAVDYLKTVHLIRTQLL